MRATRPGENGVFRMARRVLPGRRVFAVVTSALGGTPRWPSRVVSADDLASRSTARGLAINQGDTL